MARPALQGVHALGKHVYCEKPLTHSAAEARELRELARGSKVVTQMGNQGSAPPRCDAARGHPRRPLGQVREIYHWGIGVGANEGIAAGEDPVPSGFNWDLWVGPSAMRPFKKRVYHPFAWRGWFDFGNGGLADFCCHAINLPMGRWTWVAPAARREQNERQAGGRQACLGIPFPRAWQLPPVTLYWQGDGQPPAAVIQPLVDVYKDSVPGGIMIVARRLHYTDHWNDGGLIRLNGEPRLKDVLRHAATKDIPQSLPRSKGHAREWIDACRGQGKTFSDFDIGGKLTEIGLSGVVASAPARPSIGTARRCRPATPRRRPGSSTPSNGRSG